MEEGGGVEELHRQGELHLKGRPSQSPRGQKHQPRPDPLPSRCHQVLVDKADEEHVGLDQLGKGLLKLAEGGLEGTQNRHVLQYKHQGPGQAEALARETA